MAPDYDPTGARQHEVVSGGNPARHRWHENRFRLVGFLGLTAEDRVLDAGCGAGTLLVDIAPQCGVTVGLDLHHARLRFSRSRGVRRCVQAPLEQLPFVDEAFDKAVCLEVLEHLEPVRASRALKELHRVLRSGGLLLLTTPNYRSLWPVIEFLADTVGLCPEMAGGEHVSKFHRGSLREAMTQAGFTVERVGSFNHLSPFVALLSARWSHRLFQWEVRTPRAGGHLLYCLCKKT